MIELIILVGRYVIGILGTMLTLGIPYSIYKATQLQTVEDEILITILIAIGLYLILLLIAVLIGIYDKNSEIAESNKENSSKYRISSIDDTIKDISYKIASIEKKI